MHSPESCNPHILVVDDDLLTREVLSLVLGAEGYRVTTADDGLAALDQLHHGEHPDLIVLDLMMPVMDGWQFREEQLGDAQLADIPVIVCSAAGRDGQHDTDLHAAAYLDKPVEPRELVALVHRSFEGMRDEG
ncbi:MAG TPA: response regulator transcription factor [Gemmataceae bacterium]